MATKMPGIRTISMVISCLMVDSSVSLQERHAGIRVHCRCQRMISIGSRRGKSLAQGLTRTEHDGEGGTIRQAEEFRVSDTQGACGQIPQRRSSDRIPRDTRASTKTDGRRGLRSVGFPLEGRIGNDITTFNTAHLAAVVFLLRDAIGDQVPVSTHDPYGARRHDGRTF
jgi:hypothetical protein